MSKRLSIARERDAPAHQSGWAITPHFELADAEQVIHPAGRSGRRERVCAVGLEKLPSTIRTEFDARPRRGRLIPGATGGPAAHDDRFGVDDPSVLESGVRTQPRAVERCVAG